MTTHKLENLSKLSIAVLTAALGAYFKVLALPILLLVLVMAADYATGMTEAWLKGTVSSKIGLKGIIKKLCYLVLVAVAVAADWLIFTACGTMGVEFESVFLGLAVTVWLIINEIISILENLGEIGVPLPEFFRKAIQKLGKTVEETDLKE